MSSTKNWYTSPIGRGDQTGRQHVYPTINLDPAVFPPDTQLGVYASLVKIQENIYPGALYFGPRLVKDEEHDVLEIYLLDFKDSSLELYNQRASFTLEKYLRPAQDFSDLSALRAQVTKDITAVKEVFDEKI